MSRDIRRRMTVRTVPPRRDRSQFSHDALNGNAMLRMEDHTGQTSDSGNLAGRSAAALRELEERARASLAANRDYVARFEADITGQLEQIAATLQAATDAESRETEEATSAAAEVERLSAELESSRAAWAEERSALEGVRNELADQVAKIEAARAELAVQATRLEAERNATKTEWQDQLAEFEQRLNQQKSTWNDQREAWTQERASLEQERQELRHKFELALEDVQRLRGRVAELEQELARRPEASEADSAELVALRAERDALSERVEHLERQPVTQFDASSEQQLSDLQRRFELAVEDVRELKTKNARLETQLAAAGKASASAPDSGGMDWESQKRRLLASLEDSANESHEPARREERLRIENTIEMTDAIVAEKDSEIADLKARLAAVGDAPIPVDAEQEQRITELVDADEVVAEHRKRIAQLERNMEDMLRAAELEISVERAKIARQRAELEDLKAELESRPGADDSHPSGLPRRRWLSKLGLSGDEQ